ncbi:MAG: DUF2867 domain-containing protein [Thermoleophilia bacterium]|nr:DUF2867 domain-containing protein [Thermoleophilia bacterium]
MTALDTILPEPHWRERHARTVAATPEQAVQAMLGAPAIPDGAVRLLFALRGLRGTGRPVGATLEAMAFQLLHDSPDEVVYAAAGTPWRPRGGLRPFMAARAGDVRIGVDVRAEPAGAGRSVLSTETRVHAVDDEARRAFGRYWRVIRPYSGLIRRRWLQAAARALDAQ